MARPQSNWTIELLEEFAEAYAATPNHKLAKRYNVSVSTIRRKAKELNLYKDALCKYKSTFQTWMLVQDLFGDYSYDDIAKKTGVSRSTVKRIVKSLGCQLMREERNKILATNISKGLKSELRRRIFGLDNYYDRPIGMDKYRIEAANQLKEHGYIVIKGSMTAYYSDTMERYEDIENNAINNGFRLLLWL